MNEPMVLVCGRVKDRHRLPVAGSIRRLCRCGAEVTVAPSGQKWLAEHRVDLILCVECWAARSVPEDTILPIQPEQKHEIAAHYARRDHRGAN